MTIFFCPAGPMIKYNNGTLIIDDLNPEQHMTWAMSRAEMLRVGWRFIKAAFGAR